MKRLIEMEATDPLASRAQTLIHALGPTLESEARLERVRRSLDAPSKSSRPAWLWRATLAAGLLGASVAAAAGLSDVFEADAPRAVPRELPAPRELAPGASPVATPPEPAPSAVAPDPSTPGLPDTPVRARSASPRVSAAAPSSDVARVHEAARALRRDGNAERALQLLERSGSPVTGPLAEEALALRIEAAAARGDGRTAKLAAAYLAQYPNGRYRDLAKKALSGSSR